MPSYKYALVITGTIDAPHDVNAKQQVLMGVTLSARMLQFPYDVAIQMQEAPDLEPVVDPLTEEPTPIKPEVTEPRPKRGKRGSS